MNQSRILSAVLCKAVLILLSCTTANLLAYPKADAGKSAVIKPVDRSMFMTIPDKFTSIERAPVLFPHDKHTTALKAEGCAACHQNTNGIFFFATPIARDTGNHDRFRDSSHDLCLTCHSAREKAGKKSGPKTCGECHVDAIAYKEAKFLPKMPEYYSPLRDTHHRNCIACHRSPAKSAEDAKPLDWKNFYLKQKERVTIELPEVVFDYYLHDKHDKALEQKCEKCHYLAPDLKTKLDGQGKKPTAQDWLRETPKGWSLKDKEEAHDRCLNCHLQLAEKKMESGPVECRDCHSGIERSPQEMAAIPRPNHGLEHKDRFLISLSGTNENRKAAVPFDHKAHQTRSRSCQDCHHSTLEACSTCHTVKGDEKGKNITLAEAFHEPSSNWSCVGCHEKQKKRPDCAGCHFMRPSGLQQSTCNTCHSGSLDALNSARKKPEPSTLYPPNTPNVVTAALLSNEYEPSSFNHDEIAKALTEISNKSTLATYFHKSEMTICMGCHHMEPLEKGKPVALCSTCHTARPEPDGKVPALLGAYHQNCIGCHLQMDHPEEKMPRKCAGCHAEKKPAVAP